MSQQRLHQPDEEFEKYEQSVYSKFPISHHLLVTRPPGQSTASLPGNKNMTMEYRKKRSESKENNFHTLPRLSINSTYAKLRSISAFNTMYTVNHKSNIIEEELTYLKAVESGDLETVQNILERHSEPVKESVNENVSNGVANSKQETKSIPVSPLDTRYMEPEDGFEEENGRTEPKKSSAITPKDVGIEMNQFEKKSSNPPKKSLLVPRHSAANLWKIAKAGGNSSTPLPVALSSRSYSIHGDKFTLNQTDSNNPQKNMAFSKNCRDQWGRSAPFIAMLHHHMEMLELLLQYKVAVDECLYHAIDFGYYDVVELFMHFDHDTTQVITGEDSYYSPGLTPIQLAAHKNDYVMLKILYAQGFRITSDTKQKKAFSTRDERGIQETGGKTVLEKAWDNSNNQILYYRAMASPAYMVMMFNEGLECNMGKWDFLDEIFQLYLELKKKASNTPTVRSLYLPLAEQVEQFACDLLSEVRCSNDLVSLLRFEPPGQEAMRSERRYLTPVHRAIEVRMKRFVAHDNCQLAITTLRLGTLFEKDHGLRTNLLRVFYGLTFPLLCLAFVVAPKTELGKRLKNPIVNMSCHITSEITFLILMILRLALLTSGWNHCDCLGMLPSTVDYVILVWVLGRIVNEIKRLRETTFLQLATNIWHLNDLAANFLFTVVIILKVYDVIVYGAKQHIDCHSSNGNVSQDCEREKWTIKESWHITVSEGALALIYLLIFVRAMEILYTHRTFGPVQLSLDKMLLDTMRFLIIFAVTFAAFSFAMTQLYWSYGASVRMNLQGDNEAAEICSLPNSLENCYPVYSTIYDSLLAQYWTLYGYGLGLEPPDATELPNDSGTITEGFGLFFSMLFHLWAVVVMLNVLVAMLSHSFDRVRNNAELEWKFHRSGMWMKFITKGMYPRPPPMNLIPSPRDIKSFRNFIKHRVAKCCGSSATRPRQNARRDTEGNEDTSQSENFRYRQAVTRITTRYLRRYLLPDFRHDEVDQCGNKNVPGHRGSIDADDLIS